jgi:hypothetical protein
VIDRDIDRFESDLLAVLELYGKPAPTDAALALWWRTLVAYPLDAIRQALTAHAADCPFAPTPADLVARIRGLDGRPAPEEAWSIASVATDEALTVVWTDDIAEAWGIARQVLEIGDKVGARQAFIAAYERLVSMARRELVPARWRVSLGHDPQARRQALTRAVEQQRLSQHQAVALLGRPEPSNPEASDMKAVAGLLAGNVQPLPDLKARNARRFAAVVRAALEGEGRASAASTGECL